MGSTQHGHMQPLPWAGCSRGAIARRGSAGRTPRTGRRGPGAPGRPARVRAVGRRRRGRPAAARPAARTGARRGRSLGGPIRCPSRIGNDQAACMRRCRIWTTMVGKSLRARTPARFAGVTLPRRSGSARVAAATASWTARLRPTPTGTSRASRRRCTARHRYASGLAGSAARPGA